MSRDVLVTLGAGVTMDLKAALLIYAGGGRNNVFVTAHEVDRSGKEPRLSAGVPATNETLARLLTPVAAASIYRGFLPERLLAIGPGALVWWCPPAARTLWFRSDGDKGELLGDRHGRVQQPGLVFAVSDGRWYVFAVKGDKRPAPETQLCRAPYFNVWADRGEICVGNVRMPDSIGPEAIQAYERAFFESRFTHPNPGFKVRFKGGGFALWRALLDDAGRKPFPHRALVPAGLTLAQFVRRLTGRKHHAD
jgi:PRTRC genetic system protein B